MKMTRASYTNNCAVTYEPSREKNCLRCFRPGPTETKQCTGTATVDGYMLAIYFVSVIKKFEVYKILLLMHVGATY